VGSERLDAGKEIGEPTSIAIASRVGPGQQELLRPGNRLGRWLRHPTTSPITRVTGAIGLLLTQIITGLPAQLINPDWAKIYYPVVPIFSVAAKIVDRDDNGFSMVVPHDYQPDPKFLTMVGAAADPGFGQRPLHDRRRQAVAGKPGGRRHRPPQSRDTHS
jgi:hypothetical protein